MEEVQAPQLFQESGQTIGFLISRIVPERGEVYLVAFHARIPGPTGDVELAYLSLTGLKAGAWPLAVRIDVLVNTDGQPIPAASVPGVVTVR